jgi:hypothetical protein
MCDIHGIKFQRADEKYHDGGSPVNTLYLLLLDESGSMSSEWYTLIVAAR